MKNKHFRKQRKKGTIRIGDVMFIVTGDEYAQYYAELERKKYVRRQEQGKRISYEKALEDGLPIERLSANPPILYSPDSKFSGFKLAPGTSEDTSIISLST